MTPPLVSIHYRRLPDREQIFEQAVLEDAGDHVVTLTALAVVDAQERGAEQFALGCV